ncbi:unnamed protein product [Rhizopus microsporus]
MYQYPTNYNNNNNRLPLTPNSISPTREPKEIMMEGSTSSSESLNDYPQEITWLFFRDNQWVPFQSNNHYKIEQAFTLGGIYVDIKDFNFPHLKSIRVFPTRMYLSYLGMKYRLSCVIQG